MSDASMQERSESSDDTGATYMPRLLSLMNGKIPADLKTRADELTELYSTRESEIKKLGIEIPPLWSMVASNVVELIVELEKIRRAARALLHADSPATIGKIISLEQSKESFEAELPEQLDILHNVLTKMAAKMAPPPAAPGTVTTVPGAVPSATAAHREREKPQRSRSPSQDSISGHSSSGACRRRRRRRSGGSGPSRGREGHSPSPCLDSLEQASQGRRRRSQDSPPRESSVGLEKANRARPPQISRSSGEMRK